MKRKILVAFMVAALLLVTSMNLTRIHETELKPPDPIPQA